MQLFKALIIIVSAVAVGVAAWFYFTRDPACQEQPWWIVLVLGLLNLALMVYLFIRRGHTHQEKEEN